MAALTKNVYHLRSNEPGASDYYDLHDQPPGTKGPMKAASNRTT
jgi:hypothetical protein